MSHWNIRKRISHKTHDTIRDETMTTAMSDVIGIVVGVHHYVQRSAVPVKLPGRGKKTKTSYRNLKSKI